MRTDYFVPFLLANPPSCITALYIKIQPAFQPDALYRSGNLQISVCLTTCTKYLDINNTPSAAAATITPICLGGPT